MSSPDVSGCCIDFWVVTNPVEPRGIARGEIFLELKFRKADGMMAVEQLTLEQSCALRAALKKAEHAAVLNA